MTARTCVGCRRKAPVGELFRVVAGPRGELVPGAGKPGRGAWLCRGSRACYELAWKRKAFARALRTAVVPGPADAFAELAQAPMCEDVGPLGAQTSQVGAHKAAKD